MIHGVDISNYQSGLKDFGALKSGGFDFAIILATDGAAFRNPDFGRQLAGCRAAGLLTAAYHYVRSGPTAPQIDNIRQVVPRGTPVIPDVEDGSGDLAHARSMIDALRAAGYRVPLLYLPNWYWSGHLGLPNLSGLPSLWASWYPDYKTRPKEQAASLVPPAVWQGYGGRPVSITQYTSSGRVPGYSGAVDMNVFRGTRQELEDLLEDSEMLTQEDGNVRWAATDDDGHVEELPVAEWIGKSAFRTHHILVAVQELIARVTRIEQGLRPGSPSEVPPGSFAIAVADEMDRRSRDGNTATGPVS